MNPFKAFMAFPALLWLIAIVFAVLALNGAWIAILPMVVYGLMAADITVDAMELYRLGREAEHANKERAERADQATGGTAQ